MSVSTSNIIQWPVVRNSPVILRIIHNLPYAVNLTNEFNCKLSRYEKWNKSTNIVKRQAEKKKILVCGETKSNVHLAKCK